MDQRKTIEELKQLWRILSRINGRFDTDSASDYICEVIIEYEEEVIDDDDIQMLI
jgi:hypothetical protein